MTAYSPHPGGSELWQWLKNIPPWPAQLAWCHTTDAYSLRKIIGSGFFEPKTCPVFGEDLLYFFYGRPAYRNEAPSSLAHTAKAPIVIVLQPDLISKGTRLFPFDTGAFDQRYKKWLHPNMQLPDFELVCGEHAPERHVQAFFGSNADYLRLKGLVPGPPCAGHFEVESLVNLINDTSTESADDRRIAIELQVGSPIPLNASHVIALIVPEELIQVDWFETFTSGLGVGVEIQTYELALLRRASHYQVLLEDKVMEIQRNRGLM